MDLEYYLHHNPPGEINLKLEFLDKNICKWNQNTNAVVSSNFSHLVVWF